MSPKINESYNWYSVDVLDNNLSLLYKADGENFNWTSWYEPYAQDYYWKGPEIGIDANAEFKTSFQVDSGIYFIKVYNATNTGSYSLAVGEAEFFGSNFYEKTLTWIPILFYIAPYMDIVHWKKFDIRAYLPHILVLVIMFAFFFLLKRIKK